MESLFIRLSIDAWFVMIVLLGRGWVTWGQGQKINVAKLDRNFNRWYQFVYEFIFLMLGMF